MTHTATLKDFGLKLLTKKGRKTRDRQHTRQRKAWGFCDADLWNLFCGITKFILPRLIRFREMPRMGYPADLTEKRWNHILDQMIAAFKILDKEDFANKKERRIIERGLKLFAEWFELLWD